MIKYPGKLTTEQHHQIRDHLAHIWHHIDEINNIIKDIYPKAHKIKTLFNRLCPRYMSSSNSLNSFKSALDDEWCTLNKHEDQLELIYYTLDRRIEELYKK